jgi:CRP/FNR family cyclic AMP-dependent transcriptional regulator
LRIATVKTLTESVLLHIARADIARALFDNREFSELFMLYLMERNIQMQGDLVDHLLSSTENRLARLLLTLSNYGKEDPSGLIVPDITQETLAEMIGSSRTNVNLFMNKCRKLGLIEYNGKICVNRSLMNMALNEMPNTCATKLMFPVHP